MGLTDENIDGNWKFTDTDTIAKFTDWSPGEPTGGAMDKCALFYMEADFAWADQTCTDLKYQPICEKGIILLAHYIELSLVNYFISLETYKKHLINCVNEYIFTENPLCMKMF